MGYEYSSLGSSSVYSTTLQNKLCFGDMIWVVEGDASNPTNFRLVDCFKNKSQEYPPFPRDYSKFKLKVIGAHSLLNGPIVLNKDQEWFSELHAKFITKRKFFALLPSNIVNGLISFANLKN
jgi:hypothetical protein